MILLSKIVVVPFLGYAPFDFSKSHPRSHQEPCGAVALVKAADEHKITVARQLIAPVPLGRGHECGWVSDVVAVLRPEGHFVFNPPTTLDVNIRHARLEAIRRLV